MADIPQLCADGWQVLSVIARGLRGPERRTVTAGARDWFQGLFHNAPHHGGKGGQFVRIKLVWQGAKRRRFLRTEVLFLKPNLIGIGGLRTHISFYAHHKVLGGKLGDPSCES
jgi:hypothetical protein